MNEIEIKVLDIDVESTKSKIISLGGKLVKKEKQENYIYYLPPHVKNQNGYVRVRNIHNLIDNSFKVILTSKKIISQDKYRKTEEKDVEVLNLYECKSFLDSLELKFHRQENKYRESYVLNGALIEIDEWDKNIFPQPYIEIEANSEKEILDILKLLEIPENKATSKTLDQIKQEMGI